MNRKLLFSFVFLLALQPALDQCAQDNGKHSGWVQEPFSIISQTWKNIKLQSEKRPYLALGIGLTIATTAIAFIRYLYLKQNSLQTPETSCVQTHTAQPDPKPKSLSDKFFDEIEGKINDTEKTIVPSTSSTNKKLDYTASMLHLTQQYKDKITFSPEPLKKNDKQDWFWNNGSYVDSEKKIYSVTYNKIDYQSSYNVEKKCWEPANQKNTMDFKTYYRYLLDNKEAVALNNFIEYLTKKAVKSMKFPGPDSVINSLKEALIREEELKNKYVFYHGYKGTLDFWYDFIAVLHKYLDFTNYRLERSRFETRTLLNSVENDRGENGKLLIATNPCLFGNKNDTGESTYVFFILNLNVKIGTNTPRTFVSELCKNIGLSLSPGLEELYKEYAENHGKLKQIFISPEHVDEIAYTSTPYGYSYTTNIDLLKTEYPTHYQNIRRFFAGKNKNFDIKQFEDEIDVKKLSVSEIISTMRTNQIENKCFMSAFDNSEDVYAKFIDSLQARLYHTKKQFTDPEAAKKCGLEIFHYYINPEEKKLHENARKKMDVLVRKILWTALEGNTLKNGAENTKIAEFYKQQKHKE